MLQLFIIALNIVKCGLCVDNLNISGNLGNSCMREEFRNIIYKDILLDVNPEGCKDFVRTIFSYIPVTDSIMSIKSDASTLHTLLDHDAALAAVVLRIAFRKLAERNPEIDELALETLLKYFFEFIRNSNDKHAKPCLEFCYEGKGEIMQQLGSHPNVVTLLGCCTEQEPHYLILEYVMYGKLLAYLRDHRTRQDFYNFSEDSAALTSRDLTVFGYCVARGMEYLASKKIIHRDLAARNVLVDHNKLCKIADFGMSRFADGDGEVIETRHGRNALPIRWMAPESLIYSLFTTKTDVWSFGILMWEIVTLGSTPYPDMTAREVMRNVQNGYRLERPSHCRSELFRVISRCWHADPDRRPEFQTLRRDLAQLLEDNMNGHYVDLESFASECTD